MSREMAKPCVDIEISWNIAPEHCNQVASLAVLNELASSMQGRSEKRLDCSVSWNGHQREGRTPAGFGRWMAVATSSLDMVDRGEVEIVGPRSDYYRTDVEAEPLGPPELYERSYMPPFGDLWIEIFR